MNQDYEAVMKLLLDAVRSSSDSDCRDGSNTIPVGVSNRHVHLSQKDLDALFGFGYQLTPSQDLSQPGQYACRETVTLCGPKGAMEKVRVLGPVRLKTQVEVLAGDGYKLGIRAPVRLSGDLQGTPGLTLVGPNGSVQMEDGVIVAQRHIHMTPQDAIRYGVSDGQVVQVEIQGSRGGVFHHVAIRVTQESALEYHLDIEEANGMSVDASTKIKLVK